MSAIHQSILVAKANFKQIEKKSGTHPGRPDQPRVFRTIVRFENIVEEDIYYRNFRLIQF